MSRVAKLLEKGEKVGVVEIVERVYNEARKEWEYVCRCRCGNEFRCRKDHLLKPRMGCRACINKVRADLDLAGTISEEEFNKRLEVKNFEKEQKKAILGKEREARKAERERAKVERTIEKKKAMEEWKNSRLNSEMWLGRKFGRLTVIDSYVDSAKTFWVCECECGNIVTKLAKGVKFGQYISCGCKSREIMANAFTHERLYGIWHSMKYRCANKKSKNYGGRGISVCKEWNESYKVFKKWAYENGWTESLPEYHKDSLSIERIDVNGNYCPENCCFIPLWKQSQNKRPYYEREKIKTVRDRTIIEINGEKKSQREWQDYFGVSNSMLAYRVKKLGMTMEKALSEPKYEWLKKK